MEMKNYIPFLLLLIVYSCQNLTKNTELVPDKPVPIEKSRFDTILNGQQVQLFSLENKNGIYTEITNYGARVVSLWTPDSAGNFDDIVLGYNHIEDYLQSGESFFGATIGRYANRIAGGTFELNGTVYELALNNGENNLHGGPGGFHNVVWNARKINPKRLEMVYTSHDDEEGFPGNLDVKVTYELTDENELKIEYHATTDKATPVNLTHHSFFNLKGAGNGDINNHVLLINADRFTPVDANLIPTGKLEDVAGTPMDFRSPHAIGDRVNDDFEQLKLGLGYDHNWVLNTNDKGLTLAAQIYSPESKRSLKVYTNEPGIQFYGGNFLTGEDTGKEGVPYNYRSAFCLETQHFPDSPNQPDFPDVILEPDEQYYSVCIYQFGTEN